LFSDLALRSTLPFLLLFLCFSRDVFVAVLALRLAFLQLIFVSCAVSITKARARCQSLKEWKKITKEDTFLPAVSARVVAFFFIFEFFRISARAKQDGKITRRKFQPNSQASVNVVVFNTTFYEALLVIKTVRDMYERYNMIYWVKSIRLCSITAVVVYVE
jgi:hypothetical protein